MRGEVWAWVCNDHLAAQGVMREEKANWQDTDGEAVIMLAFHNNLFSKRQGFDSPSVYIFSRLASANAPLISTNVHARTGCTVDDIDRLYVQNAGPTFFATLSIVPFPSAQCIQFTIPVEGHVGHLDSGRN
jgi:hypothetical protein